MFANLFFVFNIFSVLCANEDHESKQANSSVSCYLSHTYDTTVEHLPNQSNRSNHVQYD